jgi:hypothetical protein
MFGGPRSVVHQINNLTVGTRSLFADAVNRLILNRIFFIRYEGVSSKSQGAAPGQYRTKARRSQ